MKLPFENRKIKSEYYPELDGPPITNRNRKFYAQTGNAKKPLKRRNRIKKY